MTPWTQWTNRTQIPYQSQNRRRGQTSASCIQTPPAWWPRWDTPGDEPWGCSRLLRACDWLVDRWNEAFPPWNAGWRDEECAWRQPGFEGCLPTYTQSSWPEPGYRDSSVHRLRGKEKQRQWRKEVILHHTFDSDKTMGLTPSNYLWSNLHPDEDILILQVTTLQHLLSGRERFGRQFHLLTTCTAYLFWGPKRLQSHGIRSKLNTNAQGRKHTWPEKQHQWRNLFPPYETKEKIYANTFLLIINLQMFQHGHSLMREQVSTRYFHMIKRIDPVDKKGTMK